MRAISNLFRVIISFALFLSVSGCKRFVDVPVPTVRITAESVFQSDPTAIGAVTGIYTQLINGYFSNGVNTTSLYCGLYTDELVNLYSANTIQNSYYTNNLTGVNNEFWQPVYTLLYDVNAGMIGLEASQALTPAIKQQLLGETQFMRGFFYFYLVNLFGDVPLVTDLNFDKNAVLGRTPVALVDSQIIRDLKDAENNLSDRFLDASLLNASAERLRPSKWAAAALLARIYLYTGNYDSAAAEASKVIGHSAAFNLSTLDNAFLRAGLNNNEAIWQLQPVQQGINTPDANFFIPPASGPNGYNSVVLNKRLLDAFEPADQRKSKWIGSVTANGTTYYYPYKYKIIPPNTSVNEYEMVLRLGEQYLVRAEAEANGAGGGMAAAIVDMDSIRHRAGLPDYNGPANDKDSVLAAIQHERQVELFTEWGHRFFDLKRTNAIDTVMAVVAPEKNGSWSSYKAVFPLPTYEIHVDPNLKQNTGY